MYHVKGRLLGIAFVHQLYLFDAEAGRNLVNVIVQLVPYIFLHRFAPFSHPVFIVVIADRSICLVRVVFRALPLLFHLHLLVIEKFVFTPLLDIAINVVGPLVYTHW